MAAVLVLAATLALRAQPPEEASPLLKLINSRASFLVVDMLNYTKKPDVSALGMIPGTGSAVFWPHGETGDELDETAFLKEMRKFRDFPGLFYIDLDDWPICEVPDSIAQKTIAKLSRAVDLARQAAPRLTLGIYSEVPAPGYWAVVGGDPKRRATWNACNTQLAALAKKVDVLFPSLYTFYTDERGWDLYADAALAAAREYGKPVYPFLWPEYHTSNEELGLTPIAGPFWRHQLEFVRQRADGVVLWNGLHPAWDENAGWWSETKMFLRSLRQ